MLFDAKHKREQLKDGKMDSTAKEWQTVVKGCQNDVKGTAKNPTTKGLKKRIINGCHKEGKLY